MNIGKTSPLWFGESKANDVITQIENCAKPVLLFGAYGNGNLGDAYQARSLGQIIHKIQPSLGVFTTSFSGDDYPVHPATQIAPAGTITQPDLVNRFRALLIGGGGLLASVHKPLANAQWVKRIRCPIFLIGLGASPEVVEQHEALLSEAVFVSVRDRFSLEAVRRLRPDAVMMPDPILADASLGPIGNSNPISDKVTWVLRKATPRKVEHYRRIAESLQPIDDIVGIFPNTDQASAMGDIFKDRMFLSANYEEFAQRVSGTGIVISNRYHGCIVAAKLGIPTMALDDMSERSKVFQLSQQLGFPKISKSLRKRNIIREDILRYRDRYIEQLPQIQQRLSDYSAEFERTLTPFLRILNS